ncbi:MAG: hypothetical protein LBL57_04090 [Tannerella sp.]|jgi:hypothetical protein|nr:hypothetical protein [Tannerella sp.]
MKKIKVLKQDEREIVSAKDLFLATQIKSQMEKMDGKTVEFNERIM